MSSNPSYRPCEIIEPTYGKMLITVVSPPALLIFFVCNLRQKRNASTRQHGSVYLMLNLST